MGNDGRVGKSLLEDSIICFSSRNNRQTECGVQLKTAFLLGPCGSPDTQPAVPLLLLPGPSSGFSLPIKMFFIHDQNSFPFLISPSWLLHSRQVCGCYSCTFLGAECTLKNDACLKWTLECWVLRGPHEPGSEKRQRRQADIPRSLLLLLVNLL